MSKRKEAEAFILKYIKALVPNSSNTDIYTKLFASMNDSAFEKFITDLESGARFLSIIEPNFSNSGLSVENNLAIAKDLKHEFFESLWIEGKDNMPTYLTPIKYLVVDLPLRRASQMLIKKISVPDNNKTIDTLSGQVTGASKGAKISYPELQICAAMGLESSLVELMKYRGGDTKGAVAYNGMISKYGIANLNTLSNYASGVESTTTLKTFLTSAMLKNTL
jgi:hypothetical protein